METTCSWTGVKGFGALVVQPAVILNGGKPDLEAIRDEIREVAQAEGLAEPLFFETTEDDPGAGQAAEALAAGADLIIVGGGDGTIRVVAEYLVGRTDVELAVLPLGTGNLLARNLGIDPDDVSGAIRTALLGEVHHVDALRVELVKRDRSVDSQLSLVATGVGIDAEVMSSTNGLLKKLIGPGAYVAAGLQRLAGFPKEARVRLGEGAWETVDFRTILMANAGFIQGGIEFAPGASMSDGVQDVVLYRPRTALGWSIVGVKTLWHKDLRTRMMAHVQTRKISVRPLKPVMAQIDGDPVGEVTTLTSEVVKHALRLRVPRPVDRCAPGGDLLAMLPRGFRKALDVLRS